MSTTLLEVINAGGFDPQKEEDARWLLSQVSQFEQLITECEDMIEKIEDEENKRLDQEYEDRQNE